MDWVYRTSRMVVLVIQSAKEEIWLNIGNDGPHPPMATSERIESVARKGRKGRKFSNQLKLGTLRVTRTCIARRLRPGAYNPVRHKTRVARRSSYSATTCSYLVVSIPPCKVGEAHHLEYG